MGEKTEYIKSRETVPLSIGIRLRIVVRLGPYLVQTRICSHQRTICTRTYIPLEICGKTASVVKNLWCKRCWEVQIVSKVPCN